ncbi:plasmid partitioning protein RepB [Phyllobacterium sp. 21LDTY02-6]|uniref:plasmid partitioning protein RepB n=1 Tax=Phyllobacterium sp. 21LDTY02-6 TaxID=2944903 RepID=UPI00202173B4|nr:plasmid partitioning protein RepB [Phyllobacterium sp. 21LDTY02-6]MCO4319052.1 plasmid partitioning protein RepB [Phyllobacterium sp. 21LDTY02-6]
MARKNLLAGLADTTDEPVEANYRIGGASKSMIRSVNELARQADAFLEGEQVIEIDPDVIDGSFVSDRLGSNDEDYQELLQAIKERGQDSPILVRPHPDFDSRYMIVFGHRRVRVARELHRKVRAVVKALDDKTHVIAQGQENSARANLSFIEKALFASNLEKLGYDRETISSALAANAAAVSKMVSVTTRISQDLIYRIGSAPGIGRERWVELSLLAERKSTQIAEVLASEEFGSLDSDERFSRVFAAASIKGKSAKKERLTASPAKSWISKDSSVILTMNQKAKKVAIELGNENAKPFSDWLSSRLDRLYDEFEQSKTGPAGD